MRIIAWATTRRVLNPLILVEGTVILMLCAALVHLQRTKTLEFISHSPARLPVNKSVYKHQGPSHRGHKEKKKRNNAEIKITHKIKHDRRTDCWGGERGNMGPITMTFYCRQEWASHTHTYTHTLTGHSPLQAAQSISPTRNKLYTHTIIERWSCQSERRPPVLSYSWRTGYDIQIHSLWGRTAPISNPHSPLCCSFLPSPSVFPPPSHSGYLIPPLFSRLDDDGDKCCIFHSPLLPYQWFSFLCPLLCRVCSRPLAADSTSISQRRGRQPDRHHPGIRKSPINSDKAKLLWGFKVTFVKSLSMPLCSRVVRSMAVKTIDIYFQ